MLQMPVRCGIVRACEFATCAWLGYCCCSGCHQDVSAEIGLGQEVGGCTEVRVAGNGRMVGEAGSDNWMIKAVDDVVLVGVLVMFHVWLCLMGGPRCQMVHGFMPTVHLNHLMRMH